MAVWFPFVTAADVPAAIADALDDVETAVRNASHQVRGELKTARFDVGADGKPTDADVAAAIKDATIAQLQFWAGTGDESGAVAQTGGGSILSVSLPGGGGALDARAKQEARNAPAVAEILRACPGIGWAVTY